MGFLAPSSSDVPEKLLSDSVNGLNDPLQITVLWLCCCVAMLVLARFGAGSLPYLLAVFEALLLPFEGADVSHSFVR
jgi:hypothetical protein